MSEKTKETDCCTAYIAVVSGMILILVINIVTELLTGKGFFWAHNFTN